MLVGTPEFQQIMLKFYMDNVGRHLIFQQTTFFDGQFLYFYFFLCFTLGGSQALVAEIEFWLETT